MDGLDISMDNDVTVRHASGVSVGRIDQYELVRELGGGGFGCVFLARDTVAGVDVAVKGLPPEVKHNKEELENIRENFALVSRLHHPNIAAALVLHPARQVAYSDRKTMESLRVFEGDTLLVMEYAPGMTLSGWRKRFPNHRVPYDQALAIVRQIASALDYAHDRKIVHRDIKPSNVMVEPLEDGSCTARLLDFGLAAEIRSSMGRVSREIRDTSGTRPYMAPEQWAGDKQGPSTDQYALAVMFCELIAGEVPYQSAFDSGDPVVMMTAVLHKPAHLAEAVPCKLRRPLLKALSRNPAARFARCGDFVSALGGRSVTGWPWLPALAAFLAVGVAALLWFVLAPNSTTVASDRPEGMAIKPKDIVKEDALSNSLARAEAERRAYEAAVAESNRLAQAESNRLAQAEAERRAYEAAVAESNRLAQAEAERRAYEAAVAESNRLARAEAERRAYEAAVVESNRLARAEAEQRKIRAAQASRRALMQRLEMGSQFVPELPVRPAGDEKRIRLPNGGYMDFVWCPPGRFLMGSPTTEPERNPDETQHLVTLTKGFWMGKTEVTRAQWKSVMGDARFAWTSLWGGDDAFPIDTVSWHQCNDFCRKLGPAFRLPTEAEWEYACRAGTATPFDFGTMLNGTRANCSAGAEPYGTLVSGPNSFGSKRVRSFAQNPWGLYDMHGNLFEWCSDCYAVYPMDDVSDPQGGSSGETRVVRGGCWNFKPKMCRSAFRSRKDPSSADAHTGFRVCCDRLPAD